MMGKWGNWDQISFLRELLPIGSERQNEENRGWQNTEIKRKKNVYTQKYTPYPYYIVFWTL